MREISVKEISDAVARSVQHINYHIRPDVKTALEQALAKEASPLGRHALEVLLENAQMAQAGSYPLCQDTGLTIVFVELGQEVHVQGGSLDEAIQTGLREGTHHGRLRHSVVVHPLLRTNTGDNTPAIIHTELVPGERMKISVMAKGGGCENASMLAMLPPSASRHGVSDFVIRTVKENGAAACPPLILGVGIGGNFETAPLLSKKALLRPLGQYHPDPEIAKLEEVMLTHINEIGLGPQGWGGSTTALWLAIEVAPCHIASLPVAVNVQCHSHRLMEVTL
jgi:fumarate hydratase subunit alpha